MNEESELKDFFDKIINNFQSADGKIVGEESEFIEEKLAKDDRGAWVNHLVEQYLKKEDLDEAPEEFNIKMEDIIEEIANREINKIFGQ